MQQQTLLKTVPRVIITPANRALHNLGAVLLTLGPETKGQSSKRVDVPLSDTFASGIIPTYWYLKLMECKDNLGWIGGFYFTIPMDKNGPLHISRAHMCTLCDILNRTTETPVSPPMMELLATALRPSFILLGCIEEEAGHKSPREEQVVFVQQPKLKLQNMDDG
jgi:hypothetical protein